MKLFASKDKKYDLVKVTDRAGNVYEIPVGPDGYVPQEALKARFYSRYPDIFSKGMLRDLSKSSKKIYPAKMTPEEALQWWKATNKSDVEGIDAPSDSSNYIPPVRRRAEKKKAPAKKVSKKAEVQPYEHFAINPMAGRDPYQFVADERKRLIAWMGEDASYPVNIDHAVEIKHKYDNSQVVGSLMVGGPKVDEFKDKWEAIGVISAKAIEERRAHSKAPPKPGNPFEEVLKSPLTRTGDKKPFVINPIGNRSPIDYIRDELDRLYLWMCDDVTYQSLPENAEVLRRKYGKVKNVGQYVVAGPYTKEFEEKYEEIMRRARVEERRNTAKTITPTATNVQLSAISEETARRANDVNFSRSYSEGSATREYQQVVDEVVQLGMEQKKKVDPMYWPEIDRTVQSFSRRYADWMNRKNSVDASVPSILIAGPSGISPRRKERQNNARNTLWKEYDDIMAMKDRIRSIGKGGITTDDPNAVAKIEDKLVKLQDQHESKVRINKAIRAGEGSKAFASLTDAERKEATRRIAMGAPIPGYELTNETAEIRRLKGRLDSIGKEQKRREGGSQATYPQMDGLEVVENAGENRIQLVFDDKPSDEARGILKHNGFRWSPKNSAWQRELNDNGRRAAKRAIDELISAGGWE